MSEEAAWTDEAFRPVVGNKTAVFFRKVPFKNEYKSQQAGHDIFDERTHIVKLPADMFLKIDRPIREDDKKEHPAEWAHFLATQESRPMGFPLENWQSINEAQKAEFKAMRLHTVEQIAALPDSYLQRVMGLADIRKKAQVFIESGRDAELIAKIRLEAASEVAAMKSQMEEMRAMLEQLTKPTTAA